MDLISQKSSKVSHVDLVDDVKSNNEKEKVNGNKEKANDETDGKSSRADNRKTRGGNAKKPKSRTSSK